MNVQTTHGKTAAPVFRELSAGEVEYVGGGDIIESAVGGFNVGAAFGTVAGAVVTGTTIGATRGGIIFGAMGFAGGLGWGVGTVIYDSMMQ